MQWQMCGALLGRFEGAGVSDCDGAVGIRLGVYVGDVVGPFDGAGVSDCDGAVGTRLGVTEGCIVGW